MTFSKEFFSIYVQLTMLKICPAASKMNNIQYLVLRKPEHCIFNAIFNMNLAAEIFGKVPFWKCQKQLFTDVLQNMSSEKFRKSSTKISVMQFLYNQVADPRLGLQTDYKIIKNIFFYRTPIWEHLRWLRLQRTYKPKIYFTKVAGKHLWQRLFCKKCYKPLACNFI